MYTELEKQLNVIKGSPSFCLMDNADSSKSVLQLPSIPDTPDVYWVHAKITIKNTKSLDGCICIRSGGSEQLKIMIFVADEWFPSDSQGLLDKLCLTKEDVFPLDWSYSIPVENDIYHD